MLLVNRPCPARWSGRGGGPNVIVGCVPPLNGRSSHLIEAAKRGRLDQMFFFFGAGDDAGAVDDTGAADDTGAKKNKKLLRHHFFLRNL